MKTKLQLTAKQWREFINEVRSHWLRTYQLMEQYEAIVSDHPGIKYLTGTQITFKEDIDTLRLNLRQNNNFARKIILELEEMLAEDEAANGWKGEDRVLEF